MNFTQRILTIVMAAALVLPLASCGKLDQMMGKTEPTETEQKLKEMETKMQQMEAEAKARKEAEEKARMEQEMRAKLEAEMKAKAETQPAPTAAAKPTEKVVERVIVKEKAPAAPAPAPATGTQSRASGYVRLYDDAGFTDRILTVSFGRDIGNMHYVNSDDGKSGFNDKASSVKYNVPAGWQAVLYENNNYSKRGYSLKGSGSVADLGFFGDKCSSIRWERAAE